MSMNPNQSYDTVIVVGGLVGAAIACGIAATGAKVAVLDGRDSGIGGDGLYRSKPGRGLYPLWHGPLPGSLLRHDSGTDFCT